MKLSPLAPILLGSAILSAGLTSTLAWQIVAWHIGPSAHSDDLRVPAPDLLATQIPRMQPPDNAPEWVKAMLARPLFNPSRRPTTQTLVSGVPEDLPRLAGLVVSPSGSSAIFAPPSGHSLVARPGDHVGRYLVKSVTDRNVLLAGPEGDRLIRPSFAKYETGTEPETKPIPARTVPAAGPVIPGITPGVPLDPSRQ